MPDVAGVTLDAAPANTQADPNMSTDTIAQQEAWAMQQYNDPSTGLQNYFAQTYPDLTWMAQIPGMLEIIVSGAVNGWSQGIIGGALQNNTWWQTNGTAARDWIQKKATDPATAAQELAQNEAIIKSQAQSMGISLTDSQLTGYGTQASMLGWNQQQMTQAVQEGYQVPSDGTPAPGAGAAGMRLAAQQVAGEYLTTPSNTDINFWTQIAMNNGQSAGQLQTQLQGYFGEQDSKLYPWLAAPISHGVTPKAYLQPYAQAAAATLSTTADQVDWTDPKWTGALLQTDPATGLQTPVNVDQFNKNLMQNPTFGYSKTSGAIQKAYDTASTIEATFGKVKQ